jgi:hypothetical protein
VDEVASDLHHDLEFEEVVQCDEHPDLEVEMASDLHHDWEVEEVVDVVLEVLVPTICHFNLQVMILIRYNLNLQA